MIIHLINGDLGKAFFYNLQIPKQINNKNNLNDNNNKIKQMI